MRIPSIAHFALTATLLLLTAGCYYPPGHQSAYPTETQPAYPPEANVPTALVIVVEGECTQAEYLARRSEIINYLIERGYITAESDLVSDPANALRVIRAIISGGGFTLSVFNQSASDGPLPDLETTDILYPADPYFIFGFAYLYEIGPRRLPPRPRDYHPHPRPPHSGPPSGYSDYDRDRHWSRPGQPAHSTNHAAPPPDRRRRDEDHSRPDQPTAPAADRNPANHGAPRGDNHANPPRDSNPPRHHDPSRPDQTAQPPVPTPRPKPDNQGSAHPGNRPKLPPDSISPRGPAQPQPGNGQVTPPASPSRGADRPTSPGSSNPPRNTPPAPRPAPAPQPAPEKSATPEAKERSTADPVRHEQER